MNKEQLLAALESEVKEVEVKAVGAVLRFKVLTGRGRDAFQAAITEGDKTVSHFEALVVASSVVDDSGAPMFSLDEVEALRDKNSDYVSAIATVALSVNKIGAKAEEDAAKN